MANLAPASSYASITSLDTSGELGSSLLGMLTAPDIEPGTEPSYQLCKIIYLYHPLGAKMAEAPIKMAQSQPRTITVKDAPKEVVDEFNGMWLQMHCESHILNLKRLSRVYGMAALVLGCEDQETNTPLNPVDFWKLPLYFNVFDPLNMSGSAIMNQQPNTPNFNQVVSVACNGKKYHQSRFRLALNEEPVYISYTSSGFGFVGRSVYQRALFPLKSFVKTMIADDMIATKLGALIFKMKSPGGVVNKVMQAIAAIKRKLMNMISTGQIATIDVSEDVATIDMTNVDTAGTYSRTNILKNAATAADMPAKLLENETMVGGMAEGTEDAKTIARYVDGVRVELKPDYDWCDNICRYKAWMNPDFYKRIQQLYPDQYKGVSHEEAFVEWCRAFEATWPSMLVEPESEAIKTEEVKLEGCINIIEAFLDKLDAKNQLRMITAALDNISENKRLFPYGFEMDEEELEAFLEKRQKQAEELHTSAIAPPESGGGAKGITKVDAENGDRRSRARARLSAAIARLPSIERAQRNGLSA